jgi:hypothetical protein
MLGVTRHVCKKGKEDVGSSHQIADKIYRRLLTKAAVASGHWPATYKSTAASKPAFHSNTKVLQR